MNRIRKHGTSRKLTAMLLCFSILASIVSGFGMLTAASAAGEETASSGVTNGVERQADPSTMDTYIQMLNFDQNSRYAGRLWSDKTVFAYGTASGGQVEGTDSSRTFNDNMLTLTKALDGVDGSIKLDSDFLEVFSVLGSSQQLSEHIPVDLMISLDITSSMLANGFSGNLTERKNWKNTINHTEPDGERWYTCDLNSTLHAVNKLMQGMRSYSDDTRISVVVYWGTGYQMIPFVDGDVQFTGYTVRRDAHNACEPILHYTISGEDDADDAKEFGDYVYDPVSGAHYRYNLGGAPENDTYDGQNQIKAEEGKNILYRDQEGEDVQPNGELSTDSNSPSQLGAGTNVEAGIYTAMQAVANMKKSEIKYTLSNGEVVNRIPAVVIFSDGGTNHLLVKKDDSDADRPDGNNGLGASPDSVTINGKWWEPKYPQKSAGVGIQGEDTKDGKEKDKLDPQDFDGAAVANFTGALQGAYWKAAIKNTYELDEVEDVKVYTIGVRESPIVLNPGDADDGYKKNQIPKNDFDIWKSNENTDTLFEIKTELGKNPDDANKYDKPNADPFALNRPDGTTYQFKKLENNDGEANPYNVKTSDLDLNYPTEYFRTGGNVDEEIGEILDQISDAITSELFTPVGGANDLGVDNAITYKDPIGKYMEVKDIKNLVLFGENYGLTKTAMYNYTFVSEHRTQKEEEGTFQAGWYHFGADGQWLGDTKHPGSLEKALRDTNCYKSQDGTWGTDGDGGYWAYFINTIDARKFVPNLPVKGSLANLEQKNKSEYNKLINTTYTFYRVNKDKETRETLCMNPAYGTEVPQGVVYSEDGAHLKKAGVYALSDLRIWVEDTGDYSDVAGDTLSDTDYDEALYINVPVNMLPLRTVTISPSEDGGLTYETNLPKGPNNVTPNSLQSASFPLRVFYTVGMAEDKLTADRSIDIARGISAEYIKNNKAQNGVWADARGLNENDVEFFSNWYNPENRYSDYATTNTDYSYGDPVVTFSPSRENRYYVFQRALPLYKNAYVYVANEEKWRRVSMQEDADTEATEARVFNPSDFGGRLLAVDLNATSTDNATGNTTAINEALTALATSVSPEDGDIVFLLEDRLSNVDYEVYNDPFSSDGYYFMAINYYNLGENNVATPVQYALTRKGSEFGSAYKAAGIKNGNMLCWHYIGGGGNTRIILISLTPTPAIRPEAKPISVCP